MMAPLHAFVGSDVESLALRRASGGAADILVFTRQGMITYPRGREPRPVRDDLPSGWVVGVLGSCRSSHVVLTEFGAVCPHPVEKDGEFVGGCDNSATTAFGADY